MQQINICSLRDTSSKEDYGRFTHLQCLDAQVILLLFNIGNVKSLQDVESYWIKLVPPNAKTILVGTHADTGMYYWNGPGSKDAKLPTIVQRGAAEQVALRIKALCYLEISVNAFECNYMDEPIACALRYVFLQSKKKNNQCQVQ